MSRCISPLLIRRDGERHTVPCGKCNFCLRSKRREWSFRVLQEVKASESAYFLTLTYASDRLPVSAQGLPTLRKKDYQDFTKRLRKAHSKVSSSSLRYYAVGEYGSNTLRPHYHAIMCNLLDTSLVEPAWNLGHVHVGSVSLASIHYVTGYVINRFDEFVGRDPPFSLMSRRPAIGHQYLETHRRWHKAELRNYTLVGGQMGPLPRYYKEKLYNRLERKQMALQAIQYSDENYWQELERLKAFSDDPFRYMEERIRADHDSVKNKINFAKQL